MKVYLVGGAVRDQLLGLNPKEKDYVVVGATPAQMVNLGYTQVGKDFPVFLHPKTHEEYALARTERKSGRGYGGFTVYAAPEVTLEQDLERRDLTINAIAQEENGHLIDPFHGRDDIQKKILRHVSPAFVEDPLRVLRVARFAARFRDFSIAKETQQLMKHIVDQGEMTHLVANRVWVEIEKVLAESHPALFFEILQQCGAFQSIFPSLPQEMLDKAIKNLERTAPNSDKTVKWALFVYPFLIEKTTSEIDIFCKKHTIPNHYKATLLVLARALPVYKALSETLSAENILSLLDVTDAIRRPQQLEYFLEAMSILDTNNYARLKTVIESSVAAVKAIDISELTTGNLLGTEIAKLIKQKRLSTLNRVITDNQ